MPTGNGRFAANMVGKLLAMQDQRKFTAEVAMEIVAMNIERGNAQVSDALRSAAATRT